MRKEILISITGAFLLLSVLNCGCFEDDGNEKRSVVKIISITQDPENPEAGEEITITVIVENSSGCDLGYYAYFAGGGGGPGSMTRINAGEYEKKIGPFDNGTEVWYLIGAKGYDGSINVSKNYIIQIGKIERSNITTLSISDVHQSPQNPTPEDLITVSVDVISNVTLKRVEIGYMEFSSYSNSGGGGMMLPMGGSTYEDTMSFGIADKGDYVYYKIAAQDKSGNTAVSQTYSFAIS